MKDLEDQVKPHLAPLARRGPVAVPGPAAARLLVAWAFKTAAVQEMEPNRLKPIDSTARQYLRREGAPPPGVYSSYLLR